MKNSFYRELIAQASVGYAYHKIVLDDAGKPVDYEFLDVNQAFKNLTGLRLESIAHRRVTELLPGIESDPFDWIGFYGHVALNAENWEFEQFSQPLGRWYRVQVFSPERLYFVTLFFDTTDHKLAEDALRASEAKFRLYIDKAPDGIFIMDEHGRCLDVNPAACTLLGYPADELLTMSLADGLPPEAKEEGMALLARLLETGRDKREIQLLKKDGTRVPVGMDAVRLPEGRFMILCRDIREKQEALMRLERQYTVLREIIDNHAETIFSLDDRYRYTGFNRAHREGMKELYGAEIELGVSALEYFTVPADREAAKQNYDRVLRGERLTLEIQRGDEKLSRRYFAITCNPIRDEDGAAKGIAVLARDMTERKLTELALREREQRFESILSSSPSVIYAATPEGDYKYTFISANAVDLHGYEPAILIENPWLWLHSLHPDDAPRVIEEFLRLDKTGGCTNEYRFKHRDGHYIWVRDTARLLRDGEGRPREIIGASMDITERKKHEILQLGIHNVLEAVTTGVPLEKTLDLLIRVIEEYEPEMLCSILIVSDDGKRLSLGAAPTLPESYNRAVDGLAIGPGSGSCGAAAFTKKIVIAEDIAVDPRWEKLRESGLSHNLRSSWSQPILSSNRKVLGTFAMYARVPRKPTERELYIMDTASHIAGLIIERRNVERSLIAAKEAAEEANRVKSNFLANVSHELRTPLNAIMGFSQLLEMKHGDADHERELEFLGYIRQSGEHLLEMVNDILDLSKIESGKLDLEKKPFELRAMLSRVLLTVHSLAEEKRLAIDLEIDPDLGIITADEVRLRQVIYNLLSNAIKFTPEGKRIGIKAGGDGDRAVITVWDEGIGIKKDDLEKIFDPFEQAQRPRGDGEKGTGLGLSITKKIIELHGGTLEAKSVVGEGSGFMLVIPGRSGVDTSDNKKERPS